MKNNLTVFLMVLALGACKATIPESYQKDRKVEDRTEYNGLEGYVQSQKDQHYLENKALRDKCETAKIDLAIAQTDNNTQAIKKHQQQIKEACL